MGILKKIKDRILDTGQGVEENTYAPPRQEVDWRVIPYKEDYFFPAASKTTWAQGPQWYQEALQRAGTKVKKFYLVPEPENRYDSNAVSIFAVVGKDMVRIGRLHGSEESLSLTQKLIYRENAAGRNVACVGHVFMSPSDGLRVEIFVTGIDWLRNEMAPKTKAP